MVCFYFHLILGILLDLIRFFKFPFPFDSVLFEAQEFCVHSRVSLSTDL